ncbi:MAG: NAD/NADP octopine/nopaline dehydrogenase family protein [Verrucomicrobia bacterium]|nr:NAD/NADP octopine/nopaline dehydrogenase family protein [Verrucomicrobiota bacterium]
MGKTIAVLGAGNGGQAIAAEMAMRGHQVRLYEHGDFAKAIANLFNTREIELTGSIISGKGKLERVTTDLREAVTGAEYLFLPVPAFAHATYAQTLRPLLQDGQVLVLYPGTFGTLLLRHEFAKAGFRKDIILCETHTLPYDCRIESPGRVRVLWKNNPMLVGVFPANRTNEALTRMGSDFYEFRPLTDVLEAGFCSVNPVLHLPACIMSTSRIERSRGEFWLYEEGFTPTVCRVTEAVDRERIELARAFGYTVPSLAEELAEHYQPRELFFEINGAWDLVVIKGPPDVKSRYFTEDIPFGLVPWVQLGERAGVGTPLLRALLSLGAVIIEQDVLKTGRTLSTLGIADMSVSNLKTFLKSG